jgi:hypothetical protein
MEVVKVVQEGLCRADKVAVHNGTAAGRMQTCLTVSLLVIVGRPGGAAATSIWALDADGLNHALLGAAPCVRTVGNTTTHMAASGGFKLLVAQ